MARRHDRCLSEQISRGLTAIGRYMDRRPPELHVDHRGCMRLDDLVEYWGRRRGFTEHSIVEAVRERMLQHDGQLRFGLLADEEQRILIRVMPKNVRRGRGDELGAGSHGHRRAAERRRRPSRSGSSCEEHGRSRRRRRLDVPLSTSSLPSGASSVTRGELGEARPLRPDGASEVFATSRCPGRAAPLAPVTARMPPAFAQAQVPVKAAPPRAKGTRAPAAATSSESHGGLRDVEVQAKAAPNRLRAATMAPLEAPATSSSSQQHAQGVGSKGDSLGTQQAEVEDEENSDVPCW